LSLAAHNLDIVTAHFPADIGLFLNVNGHQYPILKARVFADENVINALYAETNKGLDAYFRNA
jgi:hypothetical protein